MYRIPYIFVIVYLFIGSLQIQASNKPPDIVSFYTHASVELLSKHLSYGHSLGGESRDSKNPDVHYSWAKEAKPEEIKEELIAKFERMVEIKHSEGQQALASWYGLVCSIWGTFGVDFGNPGTNSTDLQIHKQWALKQSVSDIMGQIEMRIHMIFDSYMKSAPPSLHGEKIIVKAFAKPGKTSPAKPTEVWVQASSSQGTPVSQAEVRIHAGGGLFLSTNNLSVQGKTDFNGEFVASWKCIDCAASYVFEIEVSKPGFKTGFGEAVVNIISGEAAKPLPDLAVIDVKIFPDQPKAGDFFTVAVYVKNKGKAVSGKYDLLMHIKDLTHGVTYPVGTFRQNPLGPGDYIPWMRKEFLVNDPGSYHYWIEIRPFDFKDGNAQNNTHIFKFFVN